MRGHRSGHSSSADETLALLALGHQLTNNLVATASGFQGASVPLNNVGASVIVTTAPALAVAAGEKVVVSGIMQFSTVTAQSINWTLTDDTATFVRTGVITLPANSDLSASPVVEVLPGGVPVGNRTFRFQAQTTVDGTAGAFNSSIVAQLVRV